MSQQNKTAADLNKAINVFTKTLLWKLTEGHPVTPEEIEALNEMRVEAGMEALQVPEQATSAPAQKAPAKKETKYPEAIVHIPSDAEMLPDNDLWTNRFKFHSDSGNEYLISQNKKNRYWGCTCWPWKRTHNCKHLQGLGLPGKDTPYQAQLKKGSKTAAELIHSDSELGQKMETVPGMAHIEGPEAGPSNDELHENSHEEHGVAVTDGDLKSPERANMNAMREALETQVEMEVGKPIEQKQEEVAMQEKVQDAALAQGAGAGVGVQEVSAKPGTQIIINVASKTAASDGLKQKLNPRRFPGMSGKMVAIVGFVLDEVYTDPHITEMAVTSDGMVLAQRSDDVGMNDIIGNELDLQNNWKRLIEVAGLNNAEINEANQLWRSKIVNYRTGSAKKAAGEEHGIEQYQDNPEMWYVYHMENGAQVIDEENLDGDTAHAKACILDGVCPECEHPLTQHGGKYGCEHDLGDAPGGEGDRGPYGSYARGECGCMYQPGLKRSSELGNWCDACIMRYHPEILTSHAPGYGTVGKCEKCGNNAELRDVKISSLKKVAYVKHCPGHKNSKGELAEWCIYSHETGKIISSEKTEGAAHKQLQNMHAHSASNEGGAWSISGVTPNHETTEDVNKALKRMKASRIRISEGSGIDSNKEGVVIPWDDPRAQKEKNDYPFVSSRTPQGMGWVAILLDDGTVTSMPKNRVMQVKNSAEPIGGEDQGKVTSGMSTGMFGGTDLNGPQFHVGFTFRGQQRKARFSSYAEAHTFIREGSAKFGKMAGDWTMKCPHCGETATKDKPQDDYKCPKCGWNSQQSKKASIDPAKRSLVMELLRQGPKTTKEIETALGGGKYTMFAHPIMQELAQEGVVAHKKMRWSLKTARTEMFETAISVKTAEMSVPEKHQLRIAIQTLKAPDAMVGVMGGMDKEQALQFLAAHGLRWDDADYMAGGKGVKKAGEGMAKTEEQLEKEAGFNLFFPGQVLQEFYPEIQHEIVDYPNASNSPMAQGNPAIPGSGNPEITGDGGHDLEGMLDSALDTSIVEMVQLPADVSEPMEMAAADYSSTSPASGMGIGRDGKPEVLEGAPLRKENDIRGAMFTDEFYGQYDGVPGAAFAVASQKTAAGDEKAQFAKFLKMVCGEIAATMVAAFKVTQRPLLDKVPGVGELQLDTIEQGSQTMPMGQTSQGGRVKYLLGKLNDSDVKAAINEAWAQAAVWNDGSEGGFIYEVFVRPETIDTDSMKLVYKFVAGTRG
jgi:hypothetical protein